MTLSHATHHSRDWTTAEREDVAEVVRTTARDDTGITYRASWTGPSGGEPGGRGRRPVQ